MKIEIERKFTVNSSAFKKDAAKVMDIRQGYVGCNPRGESRISVRDEKAWLVVKGVGGISRLEYEVEIPKQDALHLLYETCPKVIHKTRYIIPAGDLKWEVDEFHDEHNGLIIAEIELPSEDYPIELPHWIGTEVTGNPAFYNKNL